jgi:hypothetical protein
VNVTVKHRGSQLPSGGVAGYVALIDGRDGGDGSDENCCNGDNGLDVFHG